MSSALALLPCLLLQGCGNTETKGVAKAGLVMPASASSKGDVLIPRTVRSAEAAKAMPRASFTDRFFAGPDSFDDRYAAALGPTSAREVIARAKVGGRTASIPGSYKLASLSPELPYVPVIKQPQTRLVGFENSAFPYFGSNPRSGEGAYARSSRYSDNRVLVHVPAGFDVRKPGVIVVFFHGHGGNEEQSLRLAQTHLALEREFCGKLE